MFENILHQSRVIDALKHDLHAGSLPQALLFTGPAWSGKLTTAIELARVLSCSTPQAPWSCRCATCQSQRHMLSPYLMLGGNRNFGQEIRGAGLGLLEEDKEASRFLFVRTVRKLTRRFDPVIWEGDPKLPKAAKLVEKIEELLEPMGPGGLWSSSTPMEGAKGKSISPQAWLGQIYEATDELDGFLPQDGINAAMIRRLTYWSHTADSAHPKFVIIEGTENLNESSRNSLLKTLEEPPPNVWFILLAKRRQGIMQTILSRCRTYQFVDRGEGEQEVLGRIFRQEKGRWQGLVDFFSAANPESRAVVERLGRGIWLLLAETVGIPLGQGQSGGKPKLADLLALAPGAKNLLEDLVREVLKEGRVMFRNLDELESGGPPRLAARLNALITLVNHESRNALTYNRSVAGFVEGVYTKARTMPCDVLSSGR